MQRRRAVLSVMVCHLWLQAFFIFHDHDLQADDVDAQGAVTAAEDTAEADLCLENAHEAHFHERKYAHDRAHVHS